jgi:hypothetical protein
MGLSTTLAPEPEASSAKGHREREKRELESPMQSSYD